MHSFLCVSNLSEVYLYVRTVQTKDFLEKKAKPTKLSSLKIQNMHINFEFSILGVSKLHPVGHLLPARRLYLASVKVSGVSPDEDSD